MTDLPSTVNTATGIPAIKIVTTHQDAIILHEVEDRELASLMNLSRPYSTAISTMTFGAFLGLLPSLTAICSKAQTGLTFGELITLAVAVACLVTAVICGILALKGLKDAARAIKSIRARPSTSVEAAR